MGLDLVATELAFPVVDGGDRGVRLLGSSSDAPRPAPRQLTRWIEASRSRNRCAIATRSSSERSPDSTNQSHTPSSRTITTDGRPSASPLASSQRTRGRGHRGRFERAAQYRELLAAIGVSATPSSGETITITVSSGHRQVRVTAVVSMSRDDAVLALEDDGFAVSVVTAPVTSSAQDGVVLAESPAGGTAPEGSTVTITVGVRTKKG